MDIQAMPPPFSVASTTPERALDRTKAVSLGKGGGGLSRRVIAGEMRACIAWRAT